jgi:DNA-binding beta-propeller fold protein YncE
MDLSADGKELWVTSRWVMKVSVLDLASGKVVRQYPVGRSPHGIFVSKAPPSASTAAPPPGGAPTPAGTPPAKPVAAPAKAAGRS